MGGRWREWEEGRDFRVLHTANRKLHGREAIRAFTLPTIPLDRDYQFLEGWCSLLQRTVALNTEPSLTGPPAA